MTTRERLEVMLGRYVEAGELSGAEALREVLSHWREPGWPPAAKQCAVCGQPFTPRRGSGRRATFCGPACRARAWRERNGKGAAGGQA
jgi:hypothetical protein